MTQPLLPNKKLWKNSKGISGIIAAIFLALIVFSFYANVFTFILIQNASFQEGVREVNQGDMDRSSEKITVSNVNYTVEEDQVYVQAQVTNDGPVSVQIITLWVVDKTTQKYGYNDTLNINLKTGDTLIFTESNSLRVTIEDSNPSNVFTSWFVTHRGNLMPFEKEEEQGVTWAEVSQGFGSIVLDFHSFRYYTYIEGTDTLQPWQDGNIGFHIDTGKAVAYGALLKNLDPNKRTLVLYSTSNIFLIHEHSNTVKWKRWYIVNVDSTGNIASTYTPISLDYGDTILIVFASANDLTDGFGKQSTPTQQQLCPLSIMVFGELGSQPYSQNIPYVSISFEVAQ